MRWPLMLRSVNDVQVKGLTALIETKDQTISGIRKDRDLYKQSAAFQKARGDGLKKLLDDAHATIADMQARLDALTPARGPGGKWVKKGGLTYPAECDTTLPTPPETNA